MSDRLLLDTNIVNFILQGNLPINNSVNGRRACLSFVAEIELLSWPVAQRADVKFIKGFISSSFAIEHSQGLKQRVIDFRRRHRLKIADAFVAASAFELDLPPVSADAVFKKIDEISFLKIEL